MSARQAASLAPAPGEERNRAQAARVRSALSQAYDAYCQLLDAGHVPDPDEFARGYPSIEAALRRQIQVHHQIEAGSSTLGQRPGTRPAWPAPGQTFLRFALGPEIGRGTFSRVFLAHEPVLGNRRVVVKIAWRGGDEAATLGPLSHRNIVPVHSVHEARSTHLTVVCMPFLGRATLQDVLDQVFIGPGLPARGSAIRDAVRGPLGADDWPDADPAPDPQRLSGTYIDAVLTMSAQIADALAFIHARGIYHRDLKPSNVLLTPHGTPMLLDFNLAQDPRSPGGRLGGTIPYMSPEQLRATAPGGLSEWSLLDGRSDVFSLGVILYELLAGVHPFEPRWLELSEAEARARLLDHQRRGPRALAQCHPGVDKPLARLVERCLAADPAQRFASAGELAEALGRCRRWPGRLRRWCRRRSRLLSAAAAVVALTALPAAYFARYPEPTALPAVAQVSRSALLVNQGWQAYDARRYRQAIGLFRKALDEDSNHGRAWVGLGRAYQSTVDFDAAIAAFEKAAAHDPDGRILACLAYCQQKNRLYARAIVSYARAIEAGYRPAEILNNLAHCHGNKGDLDTARRYLDRIIEENPAMQAARVQRAWAELRTAQGNSDYLPTIGIEDIERAIEIGPPGPDLHYLGACLHAVCATRGKPGNGHTGETLRHVQQAVQGGSDPRTFRAEPNIHALLGNNPRYLELLGRRPSMRHPSSTPLILDPVPETFR
jgi:serine/threonine protein kinase/Tfp pilus assembly protein PilF